MSTDLSSTNDQALFKKQQLLTDSLKLKQTKKTNTWQLNTHNSIYILPFYNLSKPNLTPDTPERKQFLYAPGEFQDLETKLQFSMKSKIKEDVLSTNTDIWFGYTQKSHFQFYNAEYSRPFRANDYLAEVFLTHPTKIKLPLEGDLSVLGAGAVHHSNGEGNPLSRSWNRLYINGVAKWGNLTVMPAVWVRVIPDESIEPEDNSDIVEYYGYGDIKMRYSFDSGTNVGASLRYNPLTNKGAAEVDYIYPMKNNTNLYLNIFHGYGESIVDYNHKNTSVGLGLMLQNWEGL